MNAFIVFLVVAVACIVVWNFVPAVRERLRGFTTVLDGMVMASIPVVGEVMAAFEMTNWRSFIPNEYWPWVTAGLALWFVFKRVITRTAVGTNV